ncbi:hypothetical protein N7478_002570 [Penicillium angulare]|uniref:uncharacterized protein n=1 Tax=Penicillium angulare TaxID=116970 RepID=UPI0025422AC0|nr:uncharacterized protein N7478_002570 [Penicillium angulare]KAJ5286884.1 hypothetical protein N7478_002570 [Penicillium angulare]
MRTADSGKSGAAVFAENEDGLVSVQTRNGQYQTIRPREEVGTLGTLDTAGIKVAGWKADDQY